MNRLSNLPPGATDQVVEAQWEDELDLERFAEELFAVDVCGTTLGATWLTLPERVREVYRDCARRHEAEVHPRLTRSLAEEDES